MKVRVKLANGSLVEKVTSKTSFIIGRSPKCDIPVPDDSLSRNHCQVDFENDTFYITDLSSSNGVFIDGKRIPAEKKSVFTTFQEVHIGLLEVSFTDNEEVILQRTPITKEKTSPTIAREEASTLHRPSPPSKTKGIKKKDNNFQTTIILAFLVIAGVIFYQFFYSENIAQNTSINQDSPNNFIAPRDLEYFQIADATKSCLNEYASTCDLFKLKSDNQEGTLLQNEEYFVFVLPKTNMLDSEFQKFKSPEVALELFFLRTLIQSDIFTKLQNKELKSIYLVFKNQKYQIQKAFGLSSISFKHNGVEKKLLLSAIYEAIQASDPELFWRSAQNYIQRYDF